MSLFSFCGNSVFCATSGSQQVDPSGSTSEMQSFPVSSIATDPGQISHWWGQARRGYRQHRARGARCADRHWHARARQVPADDHGQRQ